jgi:hypothetical protein
VATIDIPVSESLQKALDIPPCTKLALPMPKPLKVTLPTGGSMNAFVDMSKGIPNDCSMNFNLMLQMAPLLAALECPMKMLKLLKPLVDIINGLPAPPSPKVIKDFADAAIELAPCFGAIAAVPAMVKDLLCLVRSVLNCLLGELRTVRDLMNGLSLRLGEAEGNPDLLATLECAQDNAAASMQSLTQAIDPIAGILGLISTVAGVAGMKLDITLVPPAGPPEDLAALDALIATLQTAVDAIDTATGGSCG